MPLQCSSWEQSDGAAKNPPLSCADIILAPAEVDCHSTRPSPTGCRVNSLGGALCQTERVPQQVVAALAEQLGTTSSDWLRPFLVVFVLPECVATSGRPRVSQFTGFTGFRACPPGVLNTICWSAGGVNPPSHTTSGHDADRLVLLSSCPPRSILIIITVISFTVPISPTPRSNERRFSAEHYNHKRHPGVGIFLGPQADECRTAGRVTRLRPSGVAATDFAGVQQDWTAGPLQEPAGC